MAEHFFGMAGVEETDPRNPESKKLSASREHLIKAAEHFKQSVAAAEKMLKTIPSGGSQDFEKMVKFRLERAIQNTQALDKAVAKLANEISGGKYPKMADCLEIVSRIQDIVAVFKENAQFHKIEGM
jgi:DNA repair ATPase RecN